MLLTFVLMAEKSVAGVCVSALRHAAVLFNPGVQTDVAVVVTVMVCEPWCERERRLAAALGTSWSSRFSKTHTPTDVCWLGCVPSRACVGFVA